MRLAVKENEGQALSHKEDNAKLAAYFKEILPNYDEERVYPSDIKKILNWYGILQAKDLLVSPAAVEATPEEEAAEAVEEKAPAKKAKAKKE